MSFWNQEGDYWSNCLVEAIKAKIRHGRKIRLIIIPPWKNDVFCPHLMWHDLQDNNIKDFHGGNGYIQHWYEDFLFKGHIRCRPYKVYRRWKKTNRWR